MMQKKKIRKIYGNIIKKLAIEATKVDVNTACPCITYQPCLPENANILRKF